MDTTKRRICLPVDGSEHAKRAVMWYIENLYKKNDYAYLLFCVEAPSLPPMTITSGLNVPVESWSKNLMERIQSSESLRNEYGGVLESKKVPYDFVTKTGNRPGEIIIKFVEETNCDIITMGSRGQGLIKRNIFGSVSDYVVHHSQIPVTIVVPPE